MVALESGIQADIRERRPRLTLFSGVSVETYASTDNSILSTVQNGWIEITADGEAMWVEVERK